MALEFHEMPSTIWGSEQIFSTESQVRPVRARPLAPVANSPMVSQITFKQSGVMRMTTTKSFDFLNRLLSISNQPSASGSAAIMYSYLYNDANQPVQFTTADRRFCAYC